MGLVFNFLDRIAANKSMPLKVRFFASDLQMRMSPEAQKVDALLSEERVSEAAEIASAMPESHLSQSMTFRVAGVQARLHDRQIRAEREAQWRAEEIENARAGVRAAAEVEIQSGPLFVEQNLRKMRKVTTCPVPRVRPNDEQEPER
ncbi:hypothetical protein [Telmatospirillum sp. J64-1]|uniref:hypothetical protein n=1 Tax=Telmatospirillum sp. J64-1 TaxID=2502183 RepID=UPI00115DC851|nr:hypothetical protein [Telmatospirillum sp. J64-1]